MALAERSHLIEARELLLEAMFDESRWEAALTAVASACDARAGQLIALDGEGAVTDHWLVGAPDGFAAEIEAFGLANPQINPRVRIGAAAPLSQLIADQDYVDADERKRNAIYAEMFEPHDLPFNCQVALMREPNALVRASITRTRKQGALDDQSRSAFQALVPHLRAAVRVQANLLATRCAATLATLEAVGAAAFLLNETAGVIGASPAAERLVTEGAHLRVTRAGLRLPSHSDQTALDALISRTLSAQRAGLCRTAEPLALSCAPFVLDVQPLPRARMSFGGAPALIVIVRQVKTQEQGRALQIAYGLTGAEAQVALALAEGEAIEVIASRRRVSIATVRSQLQSIYSKMDVHRQAELAAAVHSFGVR